MTRPTVTALILLLVFTTPLQLTAETTVDESNHSLRPTTADEYANQGIDSEDTIALSATELETLIGPVALYPDDLLAIVLPASTYPVEVILASRFLDAYEADDSIEPDEVWDESVIALLNYPEVLRMMDREIDWAARLGNAVINQQADLIAAIETFRDRAYAAGNLETDEYQSVENNDGVIEITPVDEKVIYVPYYEPEKVIIYQTQPVYSYYLVPRPVYYYPYPDGYSFSNNRFWGVTTAFTIGWPNRYLNVYHRSYRGHPYYGHSYYSHYYRQPSISVYNTWYVHNSHHRSDRRYRDGDHWRSRNRHHRSRHNSTRIRNEYYAQNNRLTEHSENRGRDRRNTRNDRQGTSDGQSTSRNSTHTTRTSVNGRVNQPRVNDTTRNELTSTDRLADQEGPGQSRGRDRLNTRRDQSNTTNQPSTSRNSTNTTRTSVNGTVNQPRVNDNTRNEAASTDRLADQEGPGQSRGRDRLNTRRDQSNTTNQPSTSRNSTNTTRTSVNGTVNQPRVNDNTRNELASTDRRTDQEGSRQSQSRGRNTSADNSAIHFRDRPETNTVTSSQHPDVRRIAQAGSSRQRADATGSTSLSSYRSTTTGLTNRVQPNRTLQATTSRSSSPGRSIHQTRSQQTSTRPVAESRTSIRSHSSQQATQREASRRQMTQHQRSNSAASNGQSSPPQSVASEPRRQQQRGTQQSTPRVTTRQSPDQDRQQSTAPQANKPKRGRSRATKVH